jgi:hypothetical protein
MIQISQCSMQERSHCESGSFGGGVYGKRVPTASTMMEEQKTIANNILVFPTMLFSHNQSFNGFAAQQTTQWHSSPSDVIHSANFRRAKKKVRTVFERHIVLLDESIDFERVICANERLLD